MARQLLSEEIVRPEMPSWSQTSSDVGTLRSAATPPVDGPAAASAAPEEPPVVRVGAPPQGAAAIDLGTTVLPVLAKTYWKPLAGASLVMVLLVRWLRRR